MTLMQLLSGNLSRPNYGIVCRTMAYVSIPEFYKGRSLLITGCTGFLGQGLVEKLLRSCPEIGNIYVSIKPNKHGNTEERYQQFIKYKVFDNLRRKDPNFAQKIIPFDGDLTKPNIGLSGYLLSRMTEDVSVIVHSAALIKFNPSLRESVEANVIASRNVFHLGERCNILCAYVHVSTMFSNMHLGHVKEEIYPAIKTPDEMVNLLHNHSDAQLREMEQQLIKPSPMVYIYSKRVAENIFTHERLTVPTSVFRPPFITPALNEPFPSWTFGYGGYCGIVQNVSNGAVRHLVANPDASIEMLPVDVVVNSLISTVWYLGTGRHSDTGPLVVHAHSSSDNPIYIRDLDNAIQEHYCVENGLMFRRFKIVRKRFEHIFLYLTLYILPALYKDTVAKLRGEKTKHVKTALRLRKGLKYIEMDIRSKPTTKDFTNAKFVHSHLEDADKKEFPFDVKSIQWGNYLRSWVKNEKSRSRPAD